MANSLLCADRELAFVIDASAGSIAAAQSTNLDWSRVLDLAVQHRVYPRVARNAAHLAPEPVAGFLRERTQHNAQAALRNVARTREIVQLLGANGIDVIVLKGPLLARELYGDFALRASGDIDLLVRERDLLAAAQTLHSAGYGHHTAITTRSLAKHRRTQHDVSFSHPQDDSLVELHADVGQPHYGIRVDLERWWQDRVDVHIGEAKVGVLKAEHGYVMAAIHAAKHRWERLDLICDIAGYRKRPLDWSAIELDLADTWMLTAIRTGEQLADSFYGTKLAAAGTAAAAAQKIVAGESFGRFDGAIFDLGMRPRMGDKAAYLLKRALSAILKL